MIKITTSLDSKKFEAQAMEEIRKMLHKKITDMIAPLADEIEAEGATIEATLVNNAVKFRIENSSPELDEKIKKLLDL